MIYKGCVVVVTVGLEPTVSLRSVSFAIVALLHWRLHRSFAQHASASLSPDGEQPTGLTLSSAPIE